MMVSVFAPPEQSREKDVKSYSHPSGKQHSRVLKINIQER